MENSKVASIEFKILLAGPAKENKNQELHLKQIDGDQVNKEIPIIAFGFLKPKDKDNLKFDIGTIFKIL